VQVAPGTQSTVELQLLVIAPADAAPGDYEVSVSAQAQSNPAVSDSSQISIQVSDSGVDLSFISGPDSYLPGNSAAWQVQVTNTGDQTDTFELAVFGDLAVFAAISPSQVSLGAGQSQVIQVSIPDAPLSIMGKALLGVVAQSQSQPSIQDQAVRSVTISALESLEIAWEPGELTVTSGLSEELTLVITNTGNVASSFDLEFAASPSADLVAGATGILVNPFVLPAGNTATILVQISVPRDGVYTLVANAQNAVIQADATATLTVGNGVLDLYMPMIFK
jgi:uncharacterized membrane protein